MIKTIGQIKGLWRYPVKSLLGENCKTIDIEKRGVEGDRKYALMTTEGKLGSGKNTRRFKRIDNLFSIRAQSTSNGISVTLPDDKVLTDQSAAINQELSTALGLRVKLSQESDVSHLDRGSIHIVTTGMLLQLQNLLPDSMIDERRFRPNIVIDIFSDLPNEQLVGQTLQIGPTQLTITEPCRRCRMTTLEQDNLIYDSRILKTIAKNFDLDFGVYASVIKTGSIKLNDQVKII